MTSAFQDKPEPLDLDALSEEELGDMLFEKGEDARKGFWNLPSIVGLSLILVGVVYIFQELGLWNGFDIGVLARMLPWMGAILIILLGFGVLSWRPKKKRKFRKGRTTGKAGKKKTASASGARGGKRERKERLTKSSDKKISGVAAGIAEWFGLDPTLVRIAFVFALVATGGPPAIIAYFIMAAVMPGPEARTADPHVTIVKDT